MPKSKPPRSLWACYFALAYASVLVILTVLSIVPLSLLVAYTLSSLASYALYAFDKGAAKRGERRTPERSLHLWALFGGWIGGAFAQHMLRHKTQKEEFQLFYWLSVAVNIVAVSYLFIIEPNL